MSERFAFRRTPRRDVPARGEPRCGAAAADITPHVGFPMAGYSVAGKTSQGVSSRLHAKALYFEDAAGRPAAVCCLDLMSGSRYLLEKIAVRTAGVSGVSVDRLVLCGTHTHTAPGGFYGNALYDFFSAPEPGFHPGLADWLAGKAAQAINEAARTAVPALLGTAVIPLWGRSRNRSLDPFLGNEEAFRWHAPGFPGHGVPSDLSPELRCVDPRVTVTAAFERSGGRLIGALAAFGCHATALGTKVPLYSSDWPGVASRFASRKLRGAGASPVVLVAASAAGDVNAHVPGSRPGIDLAGSVGEAVGNAIAEAVEFAAASAGPFEVETRYAEWNVLEGPRTLDGDPATLLAPSPVFGAPTMAGSEEGRSFLFDLGLAREGMAGGHFPEGHPQHPKLPALSVLGLFVQDLLGLEPSPVLPLHALRLGDRLWVTVPGEPTSVQAFRIEKRLQARTGVRGVAVLGFAGDYGGYFTTSGEYRKQHYEGSSMLYGRNASRHLEGMLDRMLRHASETPVSEAAFRSNASSVAFVSSSRGGDGRAAVPQVAREGRDVAVSWIMPEEVVVVFAEKPFVRLEERRDGEWRPCETEDGLPLDDVHGEFTVLRKRVAPRSAAWTIRFALPDSTRPLRVVVPDWGGFPGLSVPIP